jgi:purine-binding chemotaxis protein CheW
MMDMMRQLRADPAQWQILEERARALAAPDTVADAGRSEEILTFRLGDGRYRLPAHCIHEVYPLGSYAPLPSTPPFVVGLVNVHGRLLAALDLRPLLDIATQPPLPDAMLLIVGASGMEVGLLTDVVIEVRRGTTELMPALSTIAGWGSTWVRGVDQDGYLALDPALLLADPRLVVNHTQHS